MQIRKVICTVMGHVDHGKTTILDRIRNTAVAKSEPGLITQAIGVSIIPIEAIRKICGKLLDALNVKITVPGLLFIDTPGHAAFTALRKRGGSLADIAILVVDINEGSMPQTVECIEILKAFKTPFVVAANKIDLIPGWKKQSDLLLENIEKQDARVIGEFEGKLYELVAKLNEFGFNADRFDRVRDYTREVAIVPISAATGEGIPELLMVLIGLAQRYLEESLKCDLDGPAKGTVLEVKEEKGVGITVDAIIYDGHLKINDTLLIAGLDDVIVTKVRALLEPAPLAELRLGKKFQRVKEVKAATGVKIVAPMLERAVAGMPLRSCNPEEVDAVKEELMKEVEEVLIETEKVGVIVKADSLGSLEAVAKLLREKGIPIKRGSVGEISRKDVAEAIANLGVDPLYGVILGFNVGVAKDVSIPSQIKVITSDIIYKLVEKLEEWQEAVRKAEEEKEFAKLVRPCKVEILRGYVFRQSNPAIVGVSVIEGVLRPNTPMMRVDGKSVGYVKGIQSEGQNVEKAEKGKQVAISLPDVIVGRQVKEGDILLSDVPEDDFRKLKRLKKFLSKEEIELLKEIAQIKRKTNPVWGI